LPQAPTEEQLDRKVADLRFLAAQQGSDFWPPSKRCKHCLGLPEEVRVREAALRRGYAVVAVTSFNRTSKCWHNTQPKRSEDLKVSCIQCIPGCCV
jgi:uncharacterized protein YaeQ